MTQVTIAVPTPTGLWREQMGLALARNLVGFPHDVHFLHPRGCYLDLQREACVAEALAVASDYLLFIDSDIMFPEGALLRLVSRHKDIIGGLYYERRFPLTSTVKLLEQPMDGATVEWKPPAEPFEVRAVGTGFMCINLERLTQCMGPPYFAYETAERLGLQANLGRGGEDTAFCIRARPLGLSVWCDPTIPLLHIGDYAYGKLD